MTNQKLVKNIPFVIQVSLIMFLIMVVLCIPLMLYSNHTILRLSEGEIANAALSNIEATRRLNENIMTRVSDGVLRFIRNQDFVRYGGLQKYSSIQGNVENGLKVRHIQNEFITMVKNDEAIHSIFLFFNDADYVISTDRGVVELIDYFPLTWARSFSASRKGMGGFWTPREFHSATLRDISVGNDTASSIPVLSYLYFLNHLTTALEGTIVVNVTESFIARSLNYPHDRPSNYGTMLIQRDGKVISHPDPSKVLVQSRNFPHIVEILDLEEQSGHAFFNDSGTEILYTWLKSDYFDWVYISMQSIENLVHRASLTEMTLLAVMALLTGVVASVVILSWISRPMRRFVSALREDFSLKDSGIRNEMDFFDLAFAQIKQKEQELQQALSNREKDATLLAIRSALSGDISGDQELTLLRQIFPNPAFVVAVAALDNYHAYRSRSSPEAAYHRYIFLNAVESLGTASVRVRGAPYGEGQMAIICNAAQGENIEAILETLREKAASIFGTTVTIGLSAPCSDIRDIHTRALLAAEAVLSRMTRGNNGVYPSESLKREKLGFFYPQNSESKILNALDNNKPELIEAELEAIQKKILCTSSSNDNIRFIYNQLAGTAIKHLTEMNINTSRLFFSAQGNVYSAIASCETLEELRKLMSNFYQDILDYLNQDNGKDHELPGKILHYFEAHFKEDIFFDDMAADLGISYSYMRRMVRAATGKSVLDNLNQLRIKEAKYLLLSTEKNAAEIALEVGYRNIQSLNRYFKKYEGFTPGEYRLASGVGKGKSSK